MCGNILRCVPMAYAEPCCSSLPFFYIMIWMANCPSRSAGKRTYQGKVVGQEAGCTGIKDTLEERKGRQGRWVEWLSMVHLWQSPSLLLDMFVPADVTCLFLEYRCTAPGRLTWIRIGDPRIAHVFYLEDGVEGNVLRSRGLSSDVISTQAQSQNLVKFSGSHTELGNLPQGSKHRLYFIDLLLIYWTEFFVVELLLCTRKVLNRKINKIDFPQST